LKFNLIIVGSLIIVLISNTTLAEMPRVGSGLQTEEHTWNKGSVNFSHEHFILNEGDEGWLYQECTWKDDEYNLTTICEKDYYTHYLWKVIPEGNSTWGTNSYDGYNSNQTTYDLSILPEGHYQIYLIVSDNDTITYEQLLYQLRYEYDNLDYTFSYVYVQVNPNNSTNINPSIFGIMGIGVIGLFYKKRIEIEMKRKISPVNLKALKISVIISSGINLIIYMHDCSVGRCPGNNSDIPLWFGALVITVICYSIIRYFIDKFPDGNWLAPTAGILGITLLIAMVSLSDKDSNIDEASDNQIINCFEGGADDRWCFDYETQLCVFYDTETGTLYYKEMKDLSC